MHASARVAIGLRLRVMRSSLSLVGVLGCLGCAAAPPPVEPGGDLARAAPPLAAPGDRDGDGVEDEVDACRDAPEDCDGFEDTDGCPDPDNDADRIVDLCDLCPNEPETYQGTYDLDGCPDMDHDHGCGPPGPPQPITLEVQFRPGEVRLTDPVVSRELSRWTEWSGPSARFGVCVRRLRSERRGLAQARAREIVAFLAAAGLEESQLEWHGDGVVTCGLGEDGPAGQVVSVVSADTVLARWGGDAYQLFPQPPCVMDPPPPLPFPECGEPGGSPPAPPAAPCQSRSSTVEPLPQP